MPLAYTSQATSPASGWEAACARACSPPPKPTSSHSSRGGRGKAAAGSVAWAGNRRSLGRQTSSSNLLAWAQRAAAGAAIQPLRSGLEHYLPNALRSAGARSVFSQVKVPSSGSGVRPKWP